MAGHHQWSNVKRLNGALHRNRVQLFPKLAIQIATTAKSPGSDSEKAAPLGSESFCARTLSAR